MQVREVFERTVAHLKKLGIASARLDSELLIAHGLNWDRLQIYLKYDYPLSPTELEVCRNLVRRRSQGEPIAYICGQKGFYKSDFYVETGVFIPRPETEHIVERALALIERTEKPICIVELGVGSGCVGLSLLQELPQGELLGVDISEVAVQVATKNAARRDLTQRARFVHRDAGQLDAQMLLGNWGRLADVVVANPPYIAEGDSDVEVNVKKFEPHQALYAGPDGLEKIRAWAKLSKSLLNPGGCLVFEMGTGQGAKCHAILAQLGYNEIIVGRDLAGHERWISARVPENIS